MTLSFNYIKININALQECNIDLLTAILRRWTTRGAAPSMRHLFTVVQLSFRADAEKKFRDINERAFLDNKSRSHRTILNSGSIAIRAAHFFLQFVFLFKKSYHYCMNLSLKIRKNFYNNLTVL